jgi:hypothetical protein
MFQRGLTALVMALAMATSACRRPEAAPGDAISGASPAADGRLVDDKALIDGRLLPVSHSRWDMGQTADLFDANPATLARTEKANPAVVEIRFPEPRPIGGIALEMGGADFRVTAVTAAGGGAPRTYTRDFPDSGFDPRLELDFGEDRAPVESLRIEVFDLQGGDGHIHIRTLQLR